MLAAPEGMAMLREWGVAEVQRHNHDLAWHAATRLRDALDAELLAPESMVGTMVTVRLPSTFGATAPEAAALRDALLFQDRIEVQLHEAGGRLCVRVSAQVYNDASDVEALIAALSARSKAR